ncbi:MAG: hypothetical protein ACM359_20845, partial [Bacillota bacterium]
MRWVFLAVAAVAVCIVVTACSAPPAARKPGARNELNGEVRPAQPVTPDKTDKPPISSDLLAAYRIVDGLSGRIIS